MKWKRWRQCIHDSCERLIASEFNCGILCCISNDLICVSAHDPSPTRVKSKPFNLMQRCRESVRSAVIVLNLLYDFEEGFP